MNEGQKLAITAAAFGLAIAGLIFLLYLQLAKIGWGPFEGPKSLSKQIKVQEKALSEAEAKVAQIEPRKEDLRKLQLMQESVSQLLPNESTPDVLLHFISKKADDAGAVLISIKPTKSPTSRPASSVSPFMSRGGAAGGAQKYEEWNYEIDLWGTYDQIGTFINKMEEFEISTAGGGTEKRFFAVKRLTIDAAEDGFTEYGRHDCTLVMQTFRYTGNPKAVAGR